MIIICLLVVCLWLWNYPARLYNLFTRWKILHKILLCISCNLISFISGGGGTEQEKRHDRIILSSIGQFNSNLIAVGVSLSGLHTVKCDHGKCDLSIWIAIGNQIHQLHSCSPCRCNPRMVCWRRRS